mmetsp:Transcript_10880/g.19043  ORF Transcript_10880/g.19043 Transcript_10880/m.19043 type:complete len:81 (+) Transcript_10880:763-1005(+)
MPPIQMRRLGGTYKELTTVRITSCIGHTYHSRSSMLQTEIFIGKAAAVDGYSAGTVVVSEISSLDHEGGDYSVEGAAFVS